MNVDKKRGRAQPETASKPRFSTGTEIRLALKNAPDEAGLTETLTVLRNQLTIRAGETLGADDVRLLLSRQWLEMSPGAEDIFQLVRRGAQTPVIVLSISVLACLLSLLSTHFVYHSLGQPILKTLLTAQWMRRLESHLSGSRTDLALVSLKLLNAMASYAGGKELKAILDALAWDAKVFNKLLFMRRKGKATDVSDMLVRPDIRTLTILFILSFLSSSSSSSVKSAFLEPHRDIFTCVFKGLNGDPYPVVRHILEVCWTGIWQDPKVKRTLKVGLFNETTLQQIIKLYERSNQEGPGAEDSCANLVHHFMLAIGTHRGVGVCFVDHGWYPRQSDDFEAQSDEEVGKDPRRKGGKIFNKILANVLKGLKITEDPLQRDLALKILDACPELVAGYWQGTSLTLEPRLSIKWLANVAFLGSVVSLPAPNDSFLLPLGSASTSSTALYRPTPPPLSNIMENILPSLSLKTHLTRGLQSSSALVQHSTAITLVQCLQKCETILSTFRDIVNTLEEDATNGQWTKRVSDVEREMRKRLPDFQVIVAFSNQKTLSLPSEGPSHGQQTGGYLVKTALLSEIAQRLLLLYHRCVPSVVAEASYDVGKSLQSVSEVTHEDAEDSGAGTASKASGLEYLRQLHVLRILRESDRFEWSSKATSTAHSNAYVLLKMYTKSRLPAIRNAVVELLRHVWSHSLFFQHDLDEIHLWLDSLPTGERGLGVEAPDGAPLTDEIEGVIVFLDDCMQRCAKTPYRYLDDVNSFLSVADSEANGLMTDDYLDVSPLLATLLEQFAAKVRNSLLSPSDTLALATYIRSLTFKLALKQSNSRLPEAVASRLYVVVGNGLLFSAYPVVSSALQREILILSTCSKQLIEPRVQTSPSAASASTVTEFLHQIESAPIPDSRKLRKIYAYELVDWLRLVDVQVQSMDLKRIAAIVRRFDPGAVGALYYQVAPGSGLLWSLVDAYGGAEPDSLLFDWLFLDSSSTELQSPKCKKLLIATLQEATNLSALRRYICVLVHRLADLHKPDDSIIFELVTEVVQHGKRVLVEKDYQTLKTFVFVECKRLKNAFCDYEIDTSSADELGRLIRSCIDAKRPADRHLLTDICRQWVVILKQAVSGEQVHNLSHWACLWVNYMDKADTITLTECTLERVRRVSFKSLGDLSVPFLETILHALGELSQTVNSGWLQDHLWDLIALRRLLPMNSILDTVIAKTVEASLPLGHNGEPSSSSEDLAEVISCARSRWSSRLYLPSNEFDLITFLGQDTWTFALSKAVSGILYRSSSARRTFWEWLTQSPVAVNIDPKMLVAPLLAFFDCRTNTDTELVSIDGNGNALLSTCFSAIADGLFGGDFADETNATCASLIALMLEYIPTQRAHHIGILLNNLRQQSLEQLPRAVVDLALSLSESCQSQSDQLITAVIDHGLQWCTRRLSNTVIIEVEDQSIMRTLADLIIMRKEVTSHLAETVLTAAIRDHLNDLRAMRLVSAIFTKITLKPANVNRHLQSILQHTKLLQVTSPRSLPPTRPLIIRLLHDMFYRHPTNTCQPTHIQPLVSIYGGTLAAADRMILSIFRLFELHRNLSTSATLGEWSGLDGTASATCLQALLSLESNRVFRTCLNFPVRSSLDFRDDIEYRELPEDNQLYDPIFVLLLLGSALLEDPPKSALSWVEFFRTNVVSLAIRSLSSVDVNVRRIVMSQMITISQAMKVADMQEKEQVLYILDLLRDLIPPLNDGPPPCISSFMTLVLAHALRGIFYPSNFIYPITARFLLQRHTLDPSDVPLLYGMLYSTSDDWKKERLWIVRFLGDSLHGSDDWRVFKRRHTWDILASMFQSSSDQALRHGVLELLGNLTCHTQATTSLILKSLIIQWLEMQLLTVKANERVAWVKIIGNILVVVDPEQMERATLGEWRASLLRSLRSLLQGADMHHLRLISQVVLRLALMPFPPSMLLPDVLTVALDALGGFESSSQLSLQLPELSDEVDNYAQPPHNGHGIFQLEKQDELQSWGRTVELLWQVSMTCEGKQGWNELTYRMLVWRSIVGRRRSHIGEWVRKETVVCLHSGTEHPQ